ncbi:MAG: glycerol-3-phosphate 1-O-acyltransferase PlsY [Betaproteobacteria bacterium]|nr:glycerol-3-phosphate 1-O-acyltransferase PlsY [Betaproteobacteria bacterium]
MTELALLLLAAYLIGSISFAVVVSRFYGLPDPRGHGSGNPGATNVLRTGRKSAAALTLLGDAIKGVVAVLLAKWVAEVWGLPGYVPYLAALAVFLGHLFPVFFGFKGGKGVATALGVLLALNLWVGLACAATWLVMFAITRVSSLSALVAAALAPLYGYWLVGGAAEVAALLLLSAIILARHHANIRRLLRGEETLFEKRV